MFDVCGWCDKLFDYCLFMGFFNIIGMLVILLLVGWLGDWFVGV